MLHDFTFRDPEEILAELQGGGGAHAGHAMGAALMTAMDHSQMDHSGTGEMRAPWRQAPCSTTSSMTPISPMTARWTIRKSCTVEKGGQIRLRIINGAAASNMWIDLGALEGELIAVDGNAIYPVARFAVSAGHRPARRSPHPIAGRRRRLSGAVPAGRRRHAHRHRAGHARRRDRQDRRAPETWPRRSISRRSCCIAPSQGRRMSR